MNLPFVIPGHYTKNDTLDSEKKTIIRVLGEGNKKDCFKVQNEIREFHEQEILSSYTYTPTHFSEFSSEIEFGEINNEEKEIINENIIKSEIIEEKEINNENIIKSEVIQEKEIIIKNNVKSEEDIFVESLLTKIYKENQEIISIPINFNFNYDIDKLKNLINILDIDKNTINLIVEKLITEKLKQNLFNSLKQTLINLINNNIVLTQKQNENIFQNNIVVENEIKNNETPIFNDVSNLFNQNLLNNKYL